LDHVSQSLAITFPALVIWNFADIFLLPKLEQLWRDTNLLTSKAVWILETSHLLIHTTKWLLVPGLLLLVILELCVSSWPRYRRVVVTFIAVSFHMVVLLGLAAVSTSALLAAPILEHIHK
jgi:hypothetical protein